MEVRSEEEGGDPWLQTVCFCQLRDAAKGSREQREEGGEGWGRRREEGKKALSQAIKLNIELHSSSCLSMPLLLMLPPKQRIKGLECGVGKSQALSLPACYICKSLHQKRESQAERKRQKTREVGGEPAWNVAK